MSGQRSYTIAVSLSCLSWFMFGAVRFGLQAGFGPVEGPGSKGEV